MTSRILMNASLLLLGASLLFACPTPACGQRLVFAHYMLANQDYQADTDPSQEAKIQSYEREIQEAQAIGIDGFALNAGGWLREPRYIRNAAQMFEAAARLNSGFRLMFSADMCCGNNGSDIEDMLRRFANSPRYSKVYFRHQGKPVLTTFAGDKDGPEFWQRVKSDLVTGANPSLTVEPDVLSEVKAAPSNAPVSIFLVTSFFWGGELPSKAALQPEFDRWRPTIEGSFYWGIAGVPASGGAMDQVLSSRDYASVVHAGRRLYMAPICLQFWGANANRYYEYSGAAGMRAMWMDAIQVSHPEWVEIITWNDFIEGSYISPIDDPSRYRGANDLDASGIPAGTLGYFHNHRGATALTKYFVEWYKTGKQPEIISDTLYWFYRTHPLTQDAGKPSVARKYGPVKDVIYVTANLTSAATLRVTSGTQTTTINLPKGSTDVEAPFAVGAAPEFELLRDGASVLKGRGTDPIEAAPQYNDFYYSTGALEAAISKAAMKTKGK